MKGFFALSPPLSFFPSNMSSSHLDPLPSDYLNLISKSSVSHTTNLANVSTIIARLELAKSQLAGTAPPLPKGEDDPAPSASDTLLPLSSFVKQANVNAGKESKEWGNAVNRFAKSVDKVSWYKADSDLSELMLLFDDRLAEIPGSSSSSVHSESDSFTSSDSSSESTLHFTLGRPLISSFNGPFTPSRSFLLSRRNLRFERNHRNSSRTNWCLLLPLYLPRRIPNPISHLLRTHRTTKETT